MNMRIAFKGRKKKLKQTAFSNDLCVFKIQMNTKVWVALFDWGRKKCSLVNAQNATKIKLKYQNYFISNDNETILLF